jgi:hypothetical protein
MISQISETRQPFTRRHNKSCVYYGIRGNTRSQYAYDKSCILDGAAALGEEVIENEGVLWNGAGLGQGFIQPKGALWAGAALGVGVMPVVHGRLPSLLGDAMPMLLGRGGMVSLLGDANLDVLTGFYAKVSANPLTKFYVSSGSSSSAGGGDFNFVMISRPEYEDINKALVAAGRAQIFGEPLTDADKSSLSLSAVTDADMRLGQGVNLVVPLQLAVAALQKKIADGTAANPVATGSLTNKSKVLIGLGAVAVLGVGAYFAYGRKDKGLHGAPRRRRRRR